MGFSLTGTHLIFFIAAVIVAGIVSGVFIAVTLNVSTSLSERGDRVQEQLDTDFKVINDPDSIPKTGYYYIFYLKNIGGKKLITTNETFQLFIDGDIIATTKYYFADDSLQVSKVTEIYTNASLLPGDHTLRVVGPLAVDSKFTFTI